MRKSLLTLGLATLALSSFGATRILYQQNFETAATVEETGWSFGGDKIEIASDEYGRFLELSQGQVNGRSGQVTWGQEIFLKADGTSVLGEEGKYTLQYDFSYVKGSNNQYNSCQTIFTNHAPVANQPYRNPWSPAGYWQNYLYDMSQVNTEPLGFVIDGGTVETVGEDGTTSYAIDYADSKTLGEGSWYTVTLNVDVNARTVEYSVIDYSGNELQSGTRNVPEADVNGDPISMYAEGLFIMMARYQTTVDIDNISIYFESDEDVANPPSVALTRVGQTADEELNLNLRAYTIEFMDGETLHVLGTDGQEVSVEYADYDGKYVYETTTSGVMKAWTTYGTATSEEIVTQVDCTPIVLPEGVATITAVSAGYGKTYTLSVDNSNVPLRPTIFINYEFTGEDGAVIAENGVATGAKVTVPSKGTLKITTESFGYESKTVSVENSIEFEVKQQWDFARMSDEEITKAGFPASYNVLNSGNTSGFDNWTARKRLYYNLAGSETTNDEGNVVWTAVYPFGFISADDTENILEYTQIGDGDETDVEINVAGYEMFEGISVYAGHTVAYLKHIGMVANSIKNGNNKNIDVYNCNSTDFVVINRINNYGGNSNHPVCSTNDEYYAQLEGENEVYKASEGTLNEETGLYTVSLPVYRVDTAATCVTVYKQLGGGDAVETINAVEGDGFWYTIEGVRVAEPTQPGLYIHNGKKYIVK
ncbi:MAG: hypothetical protein K2N25_06620 [Muribaculaceae bacterium]|nr:hypothetical protein [Muribaculaceae bacterium]